MRKLDSVQELTCILTHRSIKRVIFETVRKHFRGKFSTLSVSEIRQIAGRAGRYRTALQNEQAAKDEQIGGASNVTGGDREAGTATEEANQLNSDTELPRLDADPPVSVNSSDASGNIIEPSVLDEGTVAPQSQSTSTTTKASSRGPTEHPEFLDPFDPPWLVTSESQKSAVSTRAPFDNHTIGLVTTIDAADFPIVRKALETEPPPLNFATIQPPVDIVQRFAAYFPPGTPFSYILLRLSELSNTTGRYRIHHKPDMVFMADLIHRVQGLSTEDRMIFINAPGSVREVNDPQAKLLIELATCIGQQRNGALLSLKHLPLDTLDAPTAGTKPRLKALEDLHKGLILYLWLSFRFPGVFSQRPLANYTKEMVEHEIEETLRLMTFKEVGERRRELERKELRAGAGGGGAGSRVEEEIRRIVRESAWKRAGREAAAAASTAADGHGTPATSAGGASAPSVSDADASASARAHATGIAGGIDGPGEIGFAQHEGAEAITDTDGATMGAREEEENMPGDDEGVYPDEDVEDVDAAVATDSLPSSPAGRSARVHTSTDASK